MTEQVQSALSGLVVAIVILLVAFGVIGGEQADAVQGVLLAAVGFFATVGIRSARGPRKPKS